MSLKEYCEKMIKFNNKKVNDEICDIHKKFNKYVSYCFDCNLHLCKECLKTLNHINHRKNNIIEIQPIKEELDIIKEVIKDYKLKKDILKEERINKKNELNKRLINEKEKATELNLNHKEFLSDINKIK